MINFFVFIELNVYDRRNPEKAFIALRMISQVAMRFDLDTLGVVLTELLGFAESSPEMVEWAEVDKIFSVMSFTFVSAYASDDTGRLLADLFRGVFTLSC